MFASGRLRINKRKLAMSQLEELTSKPQQALLIHYSCESFVDNTRGSNRTTSIAVRQAESGQTMSFSIHQSAELLGIPNADIPKEYDKIEHKLLTDFFEFVRTHHNYNWVHWNMRDINYGFLALEHRFKVLGGTPTQIPDMRKYDLSRILVSLYGPKYIDDPKFIKLIDKNSISKKDLLPGEQEATAFKNGEYAKLHRSTLRKCDSMESILEKATCDSLKVNSNFFEKYGLSPELIAYFIKDHWFLTTLAAGYGTYLFLTEHLIPFFIKYFEVSP